MGGARFGAQMKLNASTTVFAAADLERRSYGGTDPLFLAGRRDRRVSLRVGARYTPLPKWTLTPAVDYTHNQSNIVINDFDRVTVGVTLRRDFD